MPLFHVWFATKRRRWLLQGDLEWLAEEALREAARAHGILLLECKTAIDHAHLLLQLESQDDLPRTMKALKGRSARSVFKQVEGLKLDSGAANLWQRSYGWKLVAQGAERTTRHYIRTQMDRLEKFDR